ncbi:hypothetical protein [Yersinia sp. 2545 StPb PI]|uniref:hypothetical protein n=1 Tax=Yersinia sp. 2545 StPb PI TaxID=3117410 RepID=UPI003FA429B2
MGLLVLGGLVWLSGRIYWQCVALVIISFAWGSWHGNRVLMQIEALTQGEQQVIATIKNAYLTWGEGNKVLLGIQQVNGQRVFPPIAVVVV